MTSHFFTPENQSFDETEIPPSPPAAIESSVDSETTQSDREELFWYGLCDKDRSWGQIMVAKLIEERAAHEESKQRLAAVEKECAKLKFIHRERTDDMMVMMGVLDDHRV
ncbi:hypothetical protein EG328_003453 [Venturia inaequalis]|uniref:Uncharacterized protein n=1 Tax=Venturia inaequalis TaxID=5025 RepID=A0A8H3YVG3_VENIN|nr:hypothetical protein EG328_003453 [Venturia inaequalis]